MIVEAFCSFILTITNRRFKHLSSTSYTSMDAKKPKENLSNSNNSEKHLLNSEGFYFTQQVLSETSTTTTIREWKKKTKTKTRKYSVKMCKKMK